MSGTRAGPQEYKSEQNKQRPPAPLRTLQPNGIDRIKWTNTKKSVNTSDELYEEK